MVDVSSKDGAGRGGFADCWPVGEGGMELGAEFGRDTFADNDDSMEVSGIDGGTEEGLEMTRGVAMMSSSSSSSSSSGPLWANG